MTTESSELLEAVYYSQGVPGSLEALNVLALVFDRIHFPAVHLPPVGFDEEAVRVEFKRLVEIAGETRHPRHQELIHYVGFAFQRKHVDDYCIFPGEPGGSQEPETQDVAVQLEEAIYGPPPKDFHPAWETECYMGLPGGTCITYPGWINYPANALVYAGKRGLPIVNDDPALPFPSLGNEHFKHDARLLSAIMALECVRLALPAVPVLRPVHLAEFRAQARQFVRPFRMAMLEAAGELSAAIDSGATNDDVRRAAELKAKTVVGPRLDQLRRDMAAAAPPWRKTIADLAFVSPTLAMECSHFKPEAAAAFALATVCAVLLKRDVETGAKRDQLRRSPYYYLLRLQEGDACDAQSGLEGH